MGVSQSVSLKSCEKSNTKSNKITSRKSKYVYETTRNEEKYVFPNQSRQSWGYFYRG